MEAKLAERMRVEVYKNLRTHTWSVRSMTTGLVTDHPLVALIEQAQFVVRPSGRIKVRMEQRKNVHAFVRGTRCDITTIDLEDFTRAVTYNPYIHDSFVLEDGTPIYSADLVLMTAFGVFIP
jgi:hypothetical protein